MEDLNYDKQLNETKVMLQEDDHHHQREHHDMGNTKDHDAYQDQTKIQVNTMDMDQQKIRFHGLLAR